MSSSDHEENQAQHGKDERLDEADEDLQEHEGQRGQEGTQVTDHDKQYFTSEDVAKKSEGEREDLDELADQLQDTSKSITDSLHEPAQLAYQPGETTRFAIFLPRRALEGEVPA